MQNSVWVKASKIDAFPCEKFHMYEVIDFSQFLKIFAVNPLVTQTDDFHARF